MPSNPQTGPSFIGVGSGSSPLSALAHPMMLELQTMSTTAKYDTQLALESE
jgi:hypothetical protein